MKLQKSDWVAIAVVIPIIQILCYWCIDISISAVINNPNSVVTNSWVTLSPLASYHIALYVLVLTTVLLVLVVVHNILRGEKDGREQG